MKTLLFLILLVPAGLFAQPAESRLRVGDRAPAFATVDQYGDPVSLKKMLKEGPVVLFFFRGEWCPRCNKHLSNIQDSLEMIRAYAPHVVAISPELPAYVEKTLEKTGASFELISDTNHQIMDSYGVSFRLDPETIALYKKYGVDLTEVNGNPDQTLPVPATFIIGRNGRIAYLHYNTDYMVRMPAGEIIQRLRELTE